MTFTKILEIIFDFPSILIEEVIEAGKRIFIDIKEIINGDYNEQDIEEEDTGDIPQISSESLGK